MNAEGRFRPLVAELKRRRVFRALIGYGIVGFAVLQIIEPVMHGFHWPEEVLSYVVVALAVASPSCSAWRGSSTSILAASSERLPHRPTTGHATRAPARRHREG